MADRKYTPRTPPLAGHRRVCVDHTVGFDAPCVHLCGTACVNVSIGVSAAMGPHLVRSGEILLLVVTLFPSSVTPVTAAADIHSIHCRDASRRSFTCSMTRLVVWDGGIEWTRPIHDVGTSND